MATDIDLPYLGAFLSLPEPSLSTTLTSPTPDLVASLLRAVAAKAHEYDQAHADRLKLEVELENAVRSSELKTRALKASVDRGAQQITELREQLQREESAKSALELHVQKLRTATSTSELEIDQLKARIVSLESSNRDTLSLLESKGTAYSEISSDLLEKQKKIQELRSEVARLEQVTQNASSTSVAAKLREQNLQQELEVLRRNNDWLDSELKAKSAEFAKFRKEKSARLAELQRETEDGATTIDSLRRTEKISRARIEEVTQKADSLLVRIKDLREEADSNEKNLRSELDTAKRLEQLMKESLATTKQRQQDLLDQLEQAKDDAAEEVGRLSAEVETEHQERIAAEQRIAQLETQMEHLVASNVDSTSQREGRGGDINSRGSTPARDMIQMKNVAQGTPSKIGNINLTQMVGEYHTARAELEAEKQRNAQLSATVDEMIRDIEARQPEILEMQADHTRMENDLVEMSTYADKMAKERDDARKATKKAERELHGSMHEGEILRQQLRDLSSQIKVLLMELNGHSQGAGPFSVEQRAHLEELARGDLQGKLAQDLTDTSRFISQELTTFHNVAELVDQNTKLLRVARELGERMEGEEAQAEKSQAAQNLRELEELRQKYESSRDEITSLLTQSQSYIKERDMFRRMLSQKGQLSHNSEAASAFGDLSQAQSPATPHHDKLLSIEQSPNNKDIDDYRKLLKEMQSHFDAYRQDAATDRSTLKEQLSLATQKNAELRNELSKKTGEVTLALERYDMLRGNFDMIKTENSELQKRTQDSSESAAKQDIRCQQVIEEVVEFRGLLESMRNENANLKAEKEFWKTIEVRLTNDNETLLDDRNRLNSLNTNLQNLLNEREHLDVDTRRRLQTQAESLETESQSLKRRLSEEQEELKKMNLRREYDTAQNQAKVEELSSALSTTREELIGAKTAREHLQTRVDELVIELRGADEKLQVLQSKPSGISGSNGNNAMAEGLNESDEQSLRLRIAELKKEMELVQSELTTARLQIEQYKAISQNSEDELRAFNDSHDQYRKEMDASLEAKNGRIRDLERSIATLREELTARDTELGEIRVQALQHESKLEEQKQAYENEIVRLKDTCERAEAAAQYHQEDLKTQAGIAQQAQQNYESELLKHAEAAKSVQKIRAEYSSLRLELAEARTSADAALSNLRQNEESWSEAADRYKNELSELHASREESNRQNKILHEQLESVHRQISALRKVQSGVPGLHEDADTTNFEADSANLLELIRYLRREKEIVEVQYDLANQESRRLRQHLDQSQSQLEETRQKLSQQRQADEQTERSALNHKKLLDTIEELNLNRESNSTLRMEKTQLQSSLNDKTIQIEDLQSRISPLQAKIAELEDKNEGIEQALRLAEEARSRFEQRYSDILNRSNSIDPAEFEKVSQHAATLQGERDDLQASQAALQAQVDAFPDRIKERVDEANKEFQERRQHLMEQSKNRDRAQVAKLKEKDAALQEITQAKSNSESRVKELEADLERIKKEHEEAIEQLHSQIQAESRAQGGENTETGNDQVVISGGDDSAIAAQLREQVNTAETEIAAANAKINEYEILIVSLRAEIQQLGNEVSELKTLNQGATEPTATHDELGAQEFAALRQELAQAQQEAEEQRAALLVKESATRVDLQQQNPSIEEQIKSQVDEIRTELRKRHDERLRQLDESFKTRADGMRTQLNKKLADGRADITRKLESSYKESMEKLKSDHAIETQELNDRHASELSELRIIASKSTTTPPDVTTASAQTADIYDKLSEAEIRSMLQKNEIAKKFVMNSLSNRENKVREEQQKLWSQRLAEVETKAKQTLDQAVVMEGKRSSVKITMAENRAKTANAKLEVVRQAANETPEKPVAEVWTVAQNTKLTPTASATGLQHSVHAQPPATPSTATTSRGGEAGAIESSKSANNALETPASFTGEPVGQSSNGSEATQKAVASGMTASTHAPLKPAQAPSNSGTEGPRQADPQPSGLDKPLSDENPNAGSGDQVQPALTSTTARSGIPQASSGRGSAIPQPAQRGGASAGRGRGRGGAARGGIPTVNTAQAADSGGAISSSPRSMNATAKQFVPRKRDATGAGLEGSIHASESKRAKPESK